MLYKPIKRTKRISRKDALATAKPGSRYANRNTAGMPQFLLRMSPLPRAENRTAESSQSSFGGVKSATETGRLQMDIRTLKTRGNPMPESERAFFEPRFGADFSSVRLHNDTHAQHTARSINARAFTLGNDVVFGAGEYAPGSRAGRALLAHELTHVVQQNSRLKSGRQGHAKFKYTPGEHISRQTQSNTVQRHLSINNAVSEFKSRISNPDLLKRGQFFWSYVLKIVIKTLYQTILNGSWSGAERITLQHDLDRLLALSYSPRGKAVQISRLRNKIRLFLSASSNATADDLKKIVGTGYYSSRKSGTNLFRVIWNKYHTTQAIPGLTQYARLDRLEGLSMFEYIACWSAAERVAKFFFAKGGHSIGTRSAANKISGIALCRRVRRDNTNVGGYSKGDVVIYYSNLGAAIAKVKRALDDDYHIHARILSGIYSGSTPSCRQEHSINIIGYDGNKFVFWDPDSKESAQFGGGFGFLYYDSALRRFTTAINDADLRVNNNGDHSSGSQHRYQVLTVRTM